VIRGRGGADRGPGDKVSERWMCVRERSCAKKTG
jgi:hypothetical protein